MTAGDNGHPTQADEELTAQVAELAGEISEAKTGSRRKRLAEQLPKLAARSRVRSRQGQQPPSRQPLGRPGQEPGGRQAQPRSQLVQSRLQAGRDMAMRGVQAGSSAARRSAQAGKTAAGKGAVAGGNAAKVGAQAGGTALSGVRAVGQWLAAQVIEMAPKIPIRNAATLREQHPGMNSDQLADALIEGASRASGGVGAAVGAAAAVPFLPTAPVEVGAEVLALAGIELKLIAELHEAYGMPAPGSGTERMMAYVNAWANRRGVHLTAAGVDLALGAAGRHRLERRVLIRAGQSTLSLAPLLTGVVAGAWLDHHETRRLGRRVRDDLRKQAVTHQPGDHP